MIGREFPAVLRATARGDEEAFGRLWHDLQPRLLRYFMVAMPAATEDLASETWLAVVRGLDGFKGDEPAFRAWVFTIARHKVLERRRRAADRATQAQSPDGLIERAANDPAATAPEGLSTRAALAEVATLPADQAEAIVLRVVAELGIDQVAGIMGKPPGMVRVLTHRGLRRLAERLGADRIWGLV